jgi:CDGSH-type Zn-finger protein/truncated hemoglobin YjbI
LKSWLRGTISPACMAGIAHLADKFGERRLFVGPPRAQVTQLYFSWPELIAVTDVASAQKAIDEILEQGEGPRGHWKDAHFGQFVEILDEYTALREANPAFQPARPVVTVNVRPSERDTGLPLVTDPTTRQVMDLFNVSYEVLLLMLQRFLAHTEETDAQLKALADATVALMFQAIKPIGDLVTTLPAGSDYPARTAGPSFELFYESDTVLPHREAAWILLTERLRQAAEYCEPGGPCTPAVADQLAAVRSSLTEIAASLEAHLPARDLPPETPGSAEPVDDLLARAGDFYRTGQPFTGHASELLSNLGDLIRSVYPVVLASRDDPRTVARLVNSVLRPLVEALPAPVDPASSLTTPTSDPTSAPGVPIASDVPTLWDAALLATRLRAQYGRSAPPGLLEATAALQDLACHEGPETERARRLAALADQMETARPGIMTAKNGPYLVTNAAVVRDHLGEPLTLPPQLALCRCGASAMKPFCDGTHATSGFTDDKDPKRVPDQRDTYPGEQVTIFDDRGICQHSGLCSDRLPTAFRTQAEPFVAPSGARMDELVRAVRDCPSGALSLAFDRVEARDLVDWHDVREQAIGITQDGPYRVTGGLPLTDATGADVPRAAVSSREHYALCRCGHSQNKPFCSGMHWYVEFRDPVRRPGAEPTLFEWVGGLPALTRLTRMLYERHVPADDLLAPLFATMPPGQPQREAAVMAEAFGGPPAGDAASERPGFTEEQRARWVALAIQSAADVKLPADPQFRAALTSYLEWTSRAGTPSDTAGSPPLWDWGPAGPPAEEPAPTSAAASAEDVTLPEPDETVSFAAHIKPLFREHDRQSMTFAFDLWSYDDVRAHAADILERLDNGSMPCDGAWPAEKVEVFKRWTESGFPA